MSTPLLSLVRWPSLTTAQQRAVHDLRITPEPLEFAGSVVSKTWAGEAMPAATRRGDVAPPTPREP